MRFLWICLASMLLAGAAGAVENKPGTLATAVFAGGCFWCMEHPFDALDGVEEVLPGYTGGALENPTYQQISAGGTGHYESIRVTYDPARVPYAKLLAVFWRNVDPFNADGQFCDGGDQYRAVIFYRNEEERQQAEASKQAVEKQLNAPVVTQILPAKTFYVAEEYHRHYYRKNPLRYQFYRSRCGRDARLEEVWGKPLEH